MLLFIYNLLCYVALIIIIPLHIRRIIIKGKYKKGVLERFGFISKKKLEAIDSNKKNVLFQAVSVGEVLVTLPLIKAFAAKHPEYNCILTTTTITGYAIASEKKSPSTHLFFFPLDLYGIINRTIDKLNPTIIILMETEIWPNLIAYAYKKRIPILNLNGRLSDNSFKNYCKIKFFFQHIIKKITMFGMQTAEDQKRIITLGAALANTVITGNIKIDTTKNLNFSEEEKNLFKTELNLNKYKTIIVAGSTHPGEETILSNIFINLKTNLPSLCLIIVPRHIERSLKIKKELTTKKLTVALRSEITTKYDFDILLVDTIGELSKLYSIATLVFIGKSLLPPGGGQNILEPAALGKPIIFGPYMSNFKEISAKLIKENGAICINNPTNLEKEITALLLNHDRQLQLGVNAQKFIEMNKGALSHNLRLIEQYI